MVLDKVDEQQNKGQTSGDGTPQGKGTSSAETQPSPERQPRTYTQEQVDKLTQMASVKAGRDWKAISEERDSLKKQSTDLQRQIDEFQQEREELQKRIDELASDDPQKLNLIKRDKELRDAQRQFKADRAALDNERQTHGESLKAMHGLETEIAIISIADEMGLLGECAEISRLCSSLGATTEQQIKDVVSTVWGEHKAEAETGKEEFTPDSGRTRGGSTFFTKAQITDRAFWEANREAILLAQKEGRIRD